MLAITDTLITLLIFAAVALLTQWLQRKQQKEAEPPESEQPQAPPVLRPPGRQPGAPPPRPVTLEEELRRLLEGEEPRRQPAPPPAKPVPGPAPQRPPAQRGPPPVPKPGAPKPAAPVKPAGPPPVEAVATTMAPTLPEAPAPVLPSKAEERARELERQVAEYLRTFAQPEPTERPGPAPAPLTVQAPEVVRSVAAPELAQAHARVRSAPVPEAERVKAMLRDRSSARSVFLAGVVLGPPKALQDLPRPELLP